MNANAARGVGGEDEGSLPHDLMAQNLTETVYLGRASFRITHEVEAVKAEEPARDSSTWFAHDAVILEGGPNGIAPHGMLGEGRERKQRTNSRLGRWLRSGWLMVTLPVMAFAMGMLVAQLKGSPRLRFKSWPAVATVHAPSAAAIVPPPAVAAPTEAAVHAPVVAEPAAATPVAAAPVAAAPEAALPPSTLAVAPPPSTVAPAAVIVEHVDPTTAAAEPEATREEAHPVATPAAAARQVRPAVKPHVLVVRKVKAQRPGSSESATSDGSEVTADDDTASPPPAAAKTTAAKAAAPKAAATKAAAAKAAAVKWVDPWAN